MSKPYPGFAAVAFYRRRYFRETASATLAARSRGVSSSARKLIPGSRGLVWNRRTDTPRLGDIQGNIFRHAGVAFQPPSDRLFSSALRMIVRKRRPLVLLRRVLAQLLHQNRDGLFKLRIVTLAHRLRILLHLDIGRDAEIFNFP